jgi:hypothetical protein
MILYKKQEMKKYENKDVLFLLLCSLNWMVRKNIYLTELVFCHIDCRMDVKEGQIEIVFF